jgi:integrase
MTAIQFNGGDINGLIAQLKAAGVPVQLVLNGNQPAPVAPAPSSPIPLRTVHLSEAIQRCIAAKEESGLRAAYIKSLKHYFGAFERTVGPETPVNQITLETIEGWFSARQEAPSARSSNLGRLSALFSYCWRRGWVPENPCYRIERLRQTRKPPSILSPDQVEILFRETRRRWPRALPYLTLATFAGVRPEEIQKLTWDAVDIHEGEVRIDAEVSKVHRRRITHLRPNAIEWLKLGGDLPLAKIGRRRMLARWAMVLGWDEWKQDVLRHCAASYWLVATESASKVALELGNSERILLKHYRELVRKPDAEKFWSIMP